MPNTIGAGRRRQGVWPSYRRGHPLAEEGMDSDGGGQYCITEERGDTALAARSCLRGRDVDGPRRASLLPRPPSRRPRHRLRFPRSVRPSDRGAGLRRACRAPPDRRERDRGIAVPRGRAGFDPVRRAGRREGVPGGRARLRRGLTARGVGTGHHRGLCSGSRRRGGGGIPDMRGHRDRGHSARDTDGRGRLDGRHEAARRHSTTRRSMSTTSSARSRECAASLCCWCSRRCGPWPPE
jgi:hypothetical protein